MLTQTSESDLIDRLVRHGLGQGEARCYVGMLAPKAFRVSEVAVEAGLPRSRAYELIRSLVRFGLCTEVAGGGVQRFRAVPPNEAIGRLEESLAEQARRRDLALNAILQALSGREDPRADREPVDMLRRRDQIMGGIAEAIAGAEHEVLTIMDAFWVPPICPTIRARLDAGVDFRAVPPNEAIGRLEESLAEQARRRDLALNAILEALSGREDPRADREPVDMLRRRDQIMGGIAEAIAGADHQVLMIMDAFWVPTICPTIRGRLDAGVDFRAVLDRSCLDSDPHLDWVAEYAGAPTFEARVVDPLDLMFTLVDRQVTFLNLVIPEVDVPGSRVESLRIRHAGLGRTFHDAFERLWRRGVPFEQALEGDRTPAPAGARTNPRDRAVPPARGSNGRSAEPD